MKKRVFGSPLRAGAVIVVAGLASAASAPGLFARSAARPEPTRADSLVRTRTAPGSPAANDSSAEGGWKRLSGLVMLPFESKVNGRIGDYRIGFWPAEKGRRL